jgi:WD40 repeat protein
MLVLTGAKRVVARIAFSPDAKLLATTGDGRTGHGLEMWDLPSGNLWGRYTHGMHPVDGPIAFHPTRPLFFASGPIVEIETDTKGAGLLVIEAGGRHWFHEWALLPNASGFVCQCDGSPYFDGKLYLFRRKPKQELQQVWEAKLPGLTSRSSRGLTPQVIRIAPDGDTFFTLDAKPEQGYWDSVIELARLAAWSVQSGEMLRSAKLGAGTARALAVSPDSRTVVTCTANGLRVWDANDLNAKPKEVRNDTRTHFTGIAFHPSGKYLAATSNDETVKLYDTQTWEVARTFTWKIGRMRSITFSPDGALAAAGSDSGKVIIWDVDF